MYKCAPFSGNDFRWDSIIWRKNVEGFHTVERKL